LKVSIPIAARMRIARPIANPFLIIQRRNKRTIIARSSIMNQIRVDLVFRALFAPALRFSAAFLKSAIRKKLIV
jgi:hypothetical protein